MTGRQLAKYALALAVGFIVGMMCFEQPPMDVRDFFPDPVASCVADAESVCIRLPIDKD